MKADRNM